jgi:hypothetical protein
LRDAADRAWLAGLTLFLLGLLAAGIRLAAAGGDATRFVDAGSQFVDPATAPHGLHISPGSGYDGQFVYRLALKPWDLSRTVHGITLDSGLRRQRIGLPVLGWLASGGGQPSAVPWALLAVNLAALAAVGWIGALLLRDSGKHAMWGVVPGLYFCTVYSLSLDLTEILGTAFLLGGLLLYRRQRYGSAAAVLCAGVLTRETVLVLPAAIGLIRVVALIRRRATLGRSDIVWAALVLMAWEAIVAAGYGRAPLLDDGMNAGTPFTAIVHAIGRWVRRGDAPQLLAVALLVAVVVTATRTYLLERSTSQAEVILALALSVVLSLSLSQAVWGNDNLGSFRTMTEVWVLGTVLALPRLTARMLIAPLAVDVGLAVVLMTRL